MAARRLVREDITGDTSLPNDILRTDAFIRYANRQQSICHSLKRRNGQLLAGIGQLLYRRLA